MTTKEEIEEVINSVKEFNQKWEEINRQTKLRPCPFCGGEAETVQVYANEWYVECSKCPCTMIGGYYTEEDAMTAWNKRTVEE